MLMRKLLHFAFLFMSFLLPIMGDEGFTTNNFENNRLPFFIYTSQEKCLQHLNPLSCNLDVIRHAGSDSEPLIVFDAKQINSGDSLEKGNSEENFEEEISAETPFINSENHFEKRFKVFRRKNPVARGYKRGPGFRSWGGKRNEKLFPDDLILSGSGDEEIISKRPKFQNWGGKKSTNDYSEEMEKREKENPMPYGQIEKRGLIWKNRGFYLNEPFKKHVPKRPQFQSWGGKRALYSLHQFFGPLNTKSRFSLNGGKKRKFSSWGGKRFDEYENQNGNTRPEEYFKRHSFQNWGGKRVPFDTDLLRDVPNSSEKTEESNKKKPKDDWRKDESHSSFDSGGDELKEGTNKR